MISSMHFMSTRFEVVNNFNRHVYYLWFKFYIYFVDIFPWFKFYMYIYFGDIFIPPLPEGGGGYTVLPLSVLPSILPSVQDIFCRTFLSNYWWQESDIWSYRYTILWVAFLDSSDSYFLLDDFVDFYAYWIYMLIFRLAGR